ncbi:MAG TPA: ABC transporter ATP-binding protein [Thermodesulfobacteriota bacterium]
MPTAIRLDDVVKTFPGQARPAVDGVSLDVEAGELLVLLGTSGSGKTTLLKTINRLVEPTSGRVEVEGVDVRSRPPAELRRGIGYVIQQVGLFPHQTVARNVATVPRILGWDRRRIRDRVDFLLDLVGLPPDEFRERRPRELSGGQAQRVGIARALAGDPPILLMDEPFGALDALTRGALADALLGIQRQFGKTVLFVTHDVDLALRIADRIAVMRAGRLEQVDTPAALLASPATAFVGSLLDADDILQHLAVVPVEEVMAPPGRAAGVHLHETLPEGASLKRAVSALLRSGGAPVAVVDAAGRPRGIVTWDRVQRRTQPRQPAAGDRARPGPRGG